MGYQQPKWAVYYGTIRLNDGTIETYTAAEVAALYGIEDEDYIEVSLVGPEPFTSGNDYMTYYHLKPLPDGQYFNAIERYNTENEIQWDEDFDSRRNGKWAVRPEFDHADDVE